MPAVVVLGLDSVPPELLFQRFLPHMPNVRGLLARALYGPLRTCEPPITVPAWAVFFSGVDPGTLGVYGFRHRRAGTYFDQYTPTPSTLQTAPIWDLLSRKGRRVAVLGMPPGYPPPAVNGVYVSDFLTPDNAPDSIYPSSLRPELERVAGGPLVFDVEFRHDAREKLFEELLAMTRQRWAIAREVYARGPWDLFALHDIGPDRFHHAFWKYFDPTHPRHDKAGPFLDIGERYYAELDKEIGGFLRQVGPESSVLVASDHGSKAMDGCFCINEWLMQQGLLRLKGNAPPAGSPLEKCEINWKKTSVWGAGGYYARLFFNVKGREPEGSLKGSEVAKMTQRLEQELSRVKRPDGQPLGVRVVRPETSYRQVRGDPPDLMVYFGDLAWRSAGTVGHGKLFLEENDTGPDDAVHGWDGLYALVDPRRSPAAGQGGAREDILNVAPTLLRLLGETPPSYMQGQPIARWIPE
ncbi:MAG: alkaline phosphatase family protein [Euryarchaeota archaeon]|nr:alkaline phosphatase family protein [Euryarchaeota archaeon]